VGVGLRGRLVVDAALLDGDARLLWAVPIAGLPLLTRQILGLRYAGIDEVELAAAPDHHETLRCVLSRLPASSPRDVTIVDETQPSDGMPAHTLILPVDLVIDPRVLQRLVQVFRQHRQTMICVDRLGANYAASAKSPFAFGAPGGDEGRVVDASEPSSGTLMPIGVFLECAVPADDSGSSVSSPILFDVGRYMWHRVRRDADADEATWKILLSTIKPTDGVYAKTNRRVSMRISRVLLPLPVTPNQITLFGLLCSGIAGLALAGGTYLWFLVGGLLTWFASMIDGVDGEIARAKFKATALGHWLEMTCDYAFYLAVVSGYGVGLYRATGSRLWLQLAAIGLVGVVLSFLAVARDKRMHARWEPDGDYYVGFQRRTSSRASNPVYRFTRLCNFLVSRGAFPYFIVAFAILGLSKLMFLMVVAGTQLSWILTLYAGRLKPGQTPAAPVEIRPTKGTSQGMAPLAAAGDEL